jgi:hypothetical protein
MRTTIAILIPLCCCLSCLSHEAAEPARTVRAAAWIDPLPAPEPATRDAAPSCEERLAAAELQPLDEWQQAYLAGLPRVVVAARVVPVLYLERPAASVEPRAAALRERISSARNPRSTLHEIVPAHRGQRELLRDALLSQGYLFAERPEVARALVQELALEDLFDEPTIYRLRGSEVAALTRGRDGYVDEAGEPATLLLNDRVAVDRAELEPALHVDLGLVRRESGALRTIPTGRGARDGALGFELTFPDGTTRPALVDERGDVQCVGGDGLEATLADARRFWERHDALVGAAQQMVDERLRFDEPIGEPVGVQEDGRLRLEWQLAYAAGRESFVYRDVEYPVFDARGRPVPPQVCVDFVVDSWERAGGVWFRGRGEAPGRTAGATDLSRVRRRNLAGLLAAAQDGAAPIDRYDVPERDRVALRQGDEFADALSREAGQLREGDALVIHGLRLQDGREHYHSVIVLETEPVTGVPMVVADNQGRPRVGTLSNAMRAAPLRAVKYRLRLDLARLASLQAPEAA